MTHLEDLAHPLVVLDRIKVFLQVILVQAEVL
jgi:hypothetical protein